MRSPADDIVALYERHAHAYDRTAAAPSRSGAGWTGSYEALLVSNGFAVLSHVVDDPACGGHTVWLARYEPSGDPETGGDRVARARSGRSGTQEVP